MQEIQLKEIDPVCLMDKDFYNYIYIQVSLATFSCTFFIQMK